MRLTIVILTIFCFSCKTYERSKLLSKTSKGDYEILIWDVKKYNKKNDSLISHKVDTIIRPKVDDTNLIMNSSRNQQIFNTK